MLKNIIKSLGLGADKPASKGSKGIDEAVSEAFSSNPDNPFLVSFSRTGSHWLRMIMELYFEQPSLMRAFYYPGKTNYLMLHTHDMDLDVERKRVIYLYRDPVSTIYSQLSYYKEDLNDLDRISHWADLYGRHLDKWLHSESFTEQKAILTYEGMRRDLATEFSKITDFFGQSLDKEKLEQAASQVSKNEVKKKTKHDEQVVKLDDSYASSREGFRENHGALIWDVVTKDRVCLYQYFQHLDPQDLPNKAKA